MTDSAFSQEDLSDRIIPPIQVPLNLRGDLQRGKEVVPPLNGIALAKEQQPSGKKSPNYVGLNPISLIQLRTDASSPRQSPTSY